MSAMREHFQGIKRLFFLRWDQQGLWRVSTTSRRRVHGHCDPDHRVIEIVVQHSDPDERDRLLIHEICHAVADLGHGVVWQRRMEKAAVRANELGRPRLAQLLREEVANYQERGVSLDDAYNSVEDWLMFEPDLTLQRIKRSLARMYGLLLSEVGMKFRRLEKVFHRAKQEGKEFRRRRTELAAG